MKESTNNKKHRAGIIALIIIMLGIFCMGSAMLLTRTLSGSIGINPFAWNISIIPLESNEADFTITESGNLILDMSAFQFTDVETALNLDLRLQNNTSINSTWIQQGGNFTVNNKLINGNSNMLNVVDPTGILKNIKLFVKDNSDEWVYMRDILSKDGGVVSINNYLIAGNDFRDVRFQFNFIMPVSLDEPLIYDILINFVFQPGTPTNPK